MIIMKVKILNIFLFVLAFKSISSQNLVRNPSFEEYDICPDKQVHRHSHSFNGYVRYWHNYGPIGGIYTHLDCNPILTYLDNIPLDSISPYDGKGLISLRANLKITSPVTKFETRNYYTSRLLSPLQKDSTYKVSYYIHSNKHYAIADHYGCIFARDTTDLQFTTLGDSLSMILRDDFIGYRDTFYGPDKLYHKIEGCYLANGGEEFIVFGPFLPPDKVHWYANHKGYVQDVSYIVLLDKVAVVKTTQARENDRNVEVCDGDKLILPKPVQPNTIIKDSLGREVKEINVDWPNTYTFYYEDACFGSLGSIEVSSKICIEKIDTSFTICDKEIHAFAGFIAQGYKIESASGENLTEFRSQDKGTYIFKTIHPKYGDFGEISMEVVECENCDIHIPNIISSLESSPNNLWKPKTNCAYAEYEIGIFDRWGNKVFHSTDPLLSWNGTYGGVSCQPGVYIFTLKYKFRHPVIVQKTQYKFGDITIVK